MNKKLVAGILIALSSTSSIADVKPYLGVSLNSFSINTNELTATDPNTGFSFTSTNKSRDQGSATGISGGLILNDNEKLNFSYFSGEEQKSKFLTTTVTSISYDYSFNGGGVHRGWFIGGGFSSVEIEAKKTPITTAGVAKASGALFRGGYEYLFDNNMFLEIGVNANLADVNLNFNGTGSASNVEFNSKMKVSNVYVSISHVF